MELENLNVGQRIYTNLYGSYVVYTVERLTKTQVVCDCGTRFTKSGKRVGSYPYEDHRFAKVLTKEVEDSIELSKALDSLREKSNKVYNMVRGNYKYKLGHLSLEKVQSTTSLLGSLLEDFKDK